MTSKSFQSATSSGDWEKRVAQVSKVYTGESKKTGTKEKPMPADPTITELHTYELQGTGGPYKIEIYIVNESGKPRINYFKASVAKSDS